MNIDAKVTLFTVLVYSVFYSSCIVGFVILLRAVLGTKIRARERMVIWWLAVTAMFLLLTFIHKENYIWMNFLKKHFSWVAIPTMELSLYKIGIKNDSYQLIGKTGEVYGVLSGFDKLHPTVVFQGKATIIIDCILLIWLLGFIIIWIWNLLGYAYLLRQLKKVEDCEDEDIVKKVISERGMQGISSPLKIKAIPYHFVGGVTCPCIVGFFNPTLVIIKEQWLSLSEDEQDAIIAHELTHMKKHDNLKNLVLLFLQSVFWFNPIIWIGFKYMRQDLGYLRDFQIINNIKIDKVKTYASAIVSVARLCSVKYRSSMHSGMLTSSGLGFRVRLMLEQKKGISLLGIFAIILVIAIIIGIFIYGIRVPFIQHVTVWEFVPQ